MSIKQRIEKISQYFKEMQITNANGNQVIYIVVSFPRNWIIDENIESKFGVTVLHGNEPSEYYFSTDIDSGEEVLFDAIDYNIEKMQEAIERAQLLSTKTRELKSLFENENISIESLRTLTFQYDNMPIVSNENILITKSQDNENDDNKNSKNKK